MYLYAPTIVTEKHNYTLLNVFFQIYFVSLHPISTIFFMSKE